VGAQHRARPRTEERVDELDDAPRLLAYGGERDMAKRATAALANL
jgi:hypothetical protein